MKFILIIAAFLISINSAFAQNSQRNPCYAVAGVGCNPVGTTAPLPVGSTGYPTGSTAITGNSIGTTGAVVGTLAAVSGKTTAICSFDITAIGGTAAIGPITVAGIITGSATYYLNSSATGVTFVREFNPCIPASATNTAITITTTADGTATNVSVNAHGYQY